jgi:hypothetical protein
MPRRKSQIIIGLRLAVGPAAGHGKRDRIKTEGRRVEGLGGLAFSEVATILRRYRFKVKSLSLIWTNSTRFELPQT